MKSASETVVTTPNPVRVIPSLEELLAQLDTREPFKTSDSLSGSRFERVRYHGQPMILKYVSLDDDWIMRGTGDLDCRALRFFSSKLIDRIPERIDHATVAVAPNVSRRGHRGAALLLRDVSEMLVPPGRTRIDLEQHLRFIDHMAELHAAFWGWRDDVGLIPVAHHYTFLTPGDGGPRSWPARRRSRTAGGRGRLAGAGPGRAADRFDAPPTRARSRASCHRAQRNSPDLDPCRLEARQPRRAS